MSESSPVSPSPETGHTWLADRIALLARLLTDVKAH